MRKSRVGKMEGLGTVTRRAIAIMRTGDPVLHVHSLRNRDTNVARPYCRRERGKALSSLSNLKVKPEAAESLEVGGGHHGPQAPILRRRLRRRPGGMRVCWHGCCCLAWGGGWGAAVEHALAAPGPCCSW